MIHQRHRTRLGHYLEGKTATFYHLWAMAILFLGAGMDVWLTGLWLPRAGAVVAGVAAWLYFFDPRTSDDWWLIRQQAKRGHLKQIRSEGQAASAGASAETGVSARTRAQSEMRQRLREQAQVARKLAEMAESRNITYHAAKLAHQREHDIALRAQAFWLFAGTLIWAFGDIPVELLKCGRVPC